VCAKRPRSIDVRRIATRAGAAEYTNVSLRAKLDGIRILGCHYIVTAFVIVLHFVVSISNSS